MLKKKADIGKQEMDRCRGCSWTARGLFELASLVIEILYLAMQLVRCLTQLDRQQQLLLMQPMHRNIKHTRVPGRAKKGIRSAALCGFSGQGSGS